MSIPSVMETPFLKSSSLFESEEHTDDDVKRNMTPTGAF
jgi:hypothetical protein